MPTETSSSKTSQQTVIEQLHRLPHAPENLPAYATPGAAGLDVQAAIEEPLVLKPMKRALVPTGFIMVLPDGYECQVRARSGLSIKHGITLINGVGTIDSDYRHEVMVPLVNFSSKPFTIQPGDRVAQLVIAPVCRVDWEEIADPELVAGRNGGFGSTGVGSP
jgi:dUTP pyrophosphatase